MEMIMSGRGRLFYLSNDLGRLLPFEVFSSLAFGRWTFRMFLALQLLKIKIERVLMIFVFMMMPGRSWLCVWTWHLGLGFFDQY
ncbi:hypothetical protein CPC08DRAFT_711707 [Agrocybe pediades]|nr:hypothetical protein CPC08DRAFT_711707 [Agrocybe pediades]